jgi:hypothetical protein
VRQEGRRWRVLVSCAGFLGRVCSLLLLRIAILLGLKPGHACDPTACLLGCLFSHRLTPCTLGLIPCTHRLAPYTLGQTLKVICQHCSQAIRYPNPTPTPTPNPNTQGHLSTLLSSNLVHAQRSGGTLGKRLNRLMHLLVM